jgi:basic amino acid/polyamine antiporter, APA family
MRKDEPLVRRLGFWAAVGLVIGVTIGSGIFRTPAAIAARVPDPFWMLIVWLIGGAISLCGALSVAELAASLPHTGGWYVYLRESWGRLAGFLFGWSELLLIRASAAGAIATVFAEYLLRSLGYDPGASAAVNVTAGAAIIVAALINIRGVRLGAAVTGASTVAKFAALAAIVVLAFALGGTAGASASNFTTVPVGSGFSPTTAGTFGLALISVLWAYDGFGDVSFAGGEVTNPQRTLPSAIVAGTAAILAIYLAANLAYLYVTPADGIAASRLIAADTMQRLFGQTGAVFVSIVVTISAFGALNATMLVAPRVFFAMADDRLFFRRVAIVHPRYGTPYVAILLAMALGVAFVLTRTFEQLADTFVLSIWPFYGLAIAGLYRLRRTRPDLARPYRVPGYPFVPAIFIAAVIYLVGSALFGDPVWTGVTFGIVLAGVPVYYVLFARRGRSSLTRTYP